MVTSPTGSVLRDILHITARRFPSIPILIAPVRVQGAEAPPEIVRALRDLQAEGLVDVIILARGGGSLEDLAPFNDERVARAIAASTIPVVSAVGHETDYTIADFVADLRAPTPSAAAELVVPVRRDLMTALASLSGRLAKGMDRSISSGRTGSPRHASGSEIRPGGSSTGAWRWTIACNDFRGSSRTLSRDEGIALFSPPSNCDMPAPGSGSPGMPCTWKPCTGI